MTGFDLLKQLFKIIQAMQEDGGEIAGSRLHFPLNMGEKPSQSSEEQSE